MYNGLKAINCKVIWNMKPEQGKLPEENDKFLVKSWVP